MWLANVGRAFSVEISALLEAAYPRNVRPARDDDRKGVAAIPERRATLGYDVIALRSERMLDQFDGADALLDLALAKVILTNQPNGRGDDGDNGRHFERPDEFHRTLLQRMTTGSTRMPLACVI